MTRRIGELILVTRPWLGIVSHIHPALMRWWADIVVTALIKKRDRQCYQVIKLEDTI